MDCPPSEVLMYEHMPSRFIPCYVSTCVNMNPMMSVLVSCHAVRTYVSTCVMSCCTCVSTVFTITFWRCLDNLSGQTPECPDIHIFART